MPDSNTFKIKLLNVQRYDSLSSFTVAEVTSFSPCADTPELSFSPEEALRALQSTVDSLLAVLTAEVKELKTQVSTFKVLTQYGS
ncbi:hypothetical protein EI94DRAFT_1810820 [Lactarius quietus]|nr:hypothetical protein EI94DRAFT_1810820 [Lactarius quietus]